ncbi:hypothetical protein YC2023_009381 [Brassica napus]
MHLYLGYEFTWTNGIANQSSYAECRISHFVMNSRGQTTLHGLEIFEAGRDYTLAPSTSHLPQNRSMTFKPPIKLGHDVDSMRDGF